MSTSRMFRYKLLRKSVPSFAVNMAVPTAIQKSSGFTHFYKPNYFSIPKWKPSNIDLILNYFSGPPCPAQCLNPHTGHFHCWGSTPDMCQQCKNFIQISSFPFAPLCPRFTSWRMSRLASFRHWRHLRLVFSSPEPMSLLLRKEMQVLRNYLSKLWPIDTKLGMWVAFIKTQIGIAT
jgi:hypothetical protein